MKKQKKLNLGKIKIAGVNNTNSILGGATTYCLSVNVLVNTCDCPQVTDACDSSPNKTCSGNTRAETDLCTNTTKGNDGSQQF